MKHFKLSLFRVAIVATFCSFVYSSAICGDSGSEKEVQLATKEIVNRLMGMRKPDWTWDEASISIVLQVSVPDMFFGRHKTERSLIRKMKRNYHKMTMRQKAEHIIAIKSLCLNERNISGIDPVKDMMDELKIQFPNNTRIPVVGYGMFSIGMGTVCVSGLPIDKWLVEKFIAGQNEDGSFGDSDFLMNTVRLLPPTHCLRMMSNPAYNVSKLDEVLLKMRGFAMKNMITTHAGEKFIENKFLTSRTLIGLWKTKKEGENPDTWNCRELSKTLGTYPEADESEFQLGSRLMRLHGAAYLDVGSPGYKCKEPGSIPKGYVPTCKPKKPWTCKPKNPK